MVRSAQAYERVVEQVGSSPRNASTQGASTLTTLMARFFTALGLCVFLFYMCDVLLLVHPDGGMPAAAVREWYHDELQKVPKVNDYSDICSAARRAVEVRANARYTARKKGSLLTRLGLFLRDMVVYHGKTDFTFEDMKGRHRGLADQDACQKVYASSTKTNEFYNRVVHGEGRRWLDGFWLFVAETTALYVPLMLALFGLNWALVRAASGTLCPKRAVE